MKIDKVEDTGFYFRFMFFSHFQPIRKYLWIAKKGWSNVGRIIMRIQQLGISHLEALKIIKFVRFSQSRK